MRIKEILHLFVDTVLPAVCPVCKNSAIKSPSPICQKCEIKLKLEPIPPNTASNNLSVILSCRFYDSVTANCIKQFKYSRQSRFISIFDKLILDTVSKNHSLFNTVDLAMAVPLHKTRRRERGFNQAEIVAESLSRVLAVPHSKNNLIKTKKTFPQNRLTRKQRINNLKNVFLITDPHGLSGKSVVLVDDVITTGRTLDACAENLLKAGAKKILGFTLARAVLKG
ncbi:MAG: phosphoribosyltransferase family protein [Candidatus Omnitrophota bacterium]